MQREQTRWKTSAALAAVSALWLVPSISRAQAHSMLEEAAQPPAIQLMGGQLTIQATNSSLRTILDDLGQRTGTKIEGLNRDERIFGVYGPGNPQEVLAAVLDDSGYNVLISGRNPDGSPREVVLSTRTAAAPVPAAAGRTQAAEDADEDGDATTPPQFVPPPLPQPTAAPVPQGGAPQQVKTPQQMLEELQRMRLGAAQAPPQ